MADIGTGYVRIAPNMTGMQSKIAAGMKGMGTILSNKINDEAGKTKSPLGTFFTGVKNAAVEIGKVITNELVKPAASGIVHMATSIASGFKSLAGKVANFVSPVTSRISAAFSYVGDGIAKALAPVVDRVNSIFNAISRNVTGIVTSMVDRVTGLFHRSATGATNALTPLVSRVTGIFQRVVGAVGSVLSPIGSRIASVFSGIASGITGFVSPIASRIGATFSGITNAITSNLSGTIGPIMDQLGSKVSNGLGALGGVAAKAGKGIAVGLGAGAAGIAALTIKMLNSSSALEQQLGGSEAVFGKYATNIQNIAQTSYKNMGLSQNEFLQGANKMGSLYQGAGISVQKSMEMSATSIQRATDVASIMGIDTTTALESVTAMAKGNFTMMDNLGVAMNDTALNAYALQKGIKKTTQEMSAAEKVGLATQLFMEKTAKYAGNYAKENETLAGSVNTTKKAFQDFLSGGGDIQNFIDSLINTIKIAVPQIVKILPKIVEGLGSVLSQLGPVLAQALPTLLPSLIKAVQALLNGLVANLPSIIKILLDALPMFINAFIEIFLAFIKALPQIIQIIATAMPTIINALVAGLTSPAALTAIIMGAVQLLLALIQAIPIILPALIAALPTIIKNIVATLTSPAFIASMLNVGVQLLKATISGIWSMLKSVGSAAWEIIKTIGKTLSPSSLTEIGKELIKGLWKGIQDMGSWLKEKIIDFVKDKIPGPVRKALGISSPSKVFAALGREIPRGLVQGVNKHAGLVEKSVANMANAALAGMSTDMSANLAATMPAPYVAAPNGAEGSAAGPAIVQNNSIYNQVDLDLASRELAWRIRR